MSRPRIFLGFDSDQFRACNVARQSIIRTAYTYPIIQHIDMYELSARGLYRRPTWRRLDDSPGFWDDISDAPMSTGHAIARFLTPLLCEFKGFALFCDGDVLFRRDVGDLFALADESKAVQVVQHHFEPTEAVKMTGQEQTRYQRKNWSSVMLFNCGHPANAALTTELVNTVPGRDLHRFCWLEDHQIGALPPEWNFLVGHSDADINPAIVHFTDGVPDMRGYADVDYADEWFATAKDAGMKIDRPRVVA
jgi:hypothetical protein